MTSESLFVNADLAATGDAPNSQVTQSGGSDNPAPLHPNNFKSVSYSQRLQDGYIQVLDRYDWDWFVTHTFTEAVHPEQSIKYWKRWVNQLNREIYGKNFSKYTRGVTYCLATEKQKNGNIHLHALIRFSKDRSKYQHESNRLRYMQHWEQIGLLTGYSRIFPCQQQAVIRYVSKYVIKEGDLDFGGDLTDTRVAIKGEHSEVATLRA